MVMVVIMVVMVARVIMVMVMFKGADYGGGCDGDDGCGGGGDDDNGKRLFFPECGVFGGTPVGICVFAVESVEQKIVGALLRHEPLHKQSDRGRRHDNDKL